jgi:hypothetical protein
VHERIPALLSASPVAQFGSLGRTLMRVLLRAIVSLALGWVVISLCILLSMMGLFPVSLQDALLSPAVLFTPFVPFFTVPLNGPGPAEILALRVFDTGLVALMIFFALTYWSRRSRNRRAA